MNFRKQPSWKQQFKDKGFYITLALCLVAVGIVAFIGFRNSAPEAEPDTPDEDISTTSSLYSVVTTAQPAQNPVTNVADLRTTTATTTTQGTTTTSPPAPQDLYVLPFGNEVCRPFSDTQPIFSATMGDWRTHSGVDFTGEAGAAVRAAADGEIRLIRVDVLWGDIIEIDHGFGIISRYCGVAARNIAVGDRVSAGEEIGVLTTIPCESADQSHLHVEVIASGKPLDPIAVIGVEVRYAASDEN